MWHRYVVHDDLELKLNDNNLMLFYWYFIGLYVIIICNVSIILDGILGTQNVIG